MRSFLPLFAFAITVTLLALLERTKVLENIRDVPNHRSLHTRPIPRIGGIGLWAGASIGLIVLTQADLLLLIVPGILLTTISFIDDARGLPAWARFSAHFCTAALFVVPAYGPSLSISAQILLVVAIVWMINLYNFMDGADGLAGGMTVIGFSVYGIGELLGGNSDLAIFDFCIVTAAAGFLLYNLHPAKIFLGDAGAIPLGFAAGSLGVFGWSRHTWPFWFPILAFSPFIVDATLTLIKRCSRRERIWEAHREHYYQRIVRMGWGHRRTAMAEYVLMICVGSTALAGLHWTWPMQLMLFFFWASVYLGLAFLLDRAWRRFQIVESLK